MAFRDIFKDKNEINEKTVVGFISFAIMVIYALLSVTFTLLGYAFPINETIYTSFVTVTLGSFGIAAVGSAISDYGDSRGRRGNRNNIKPLDDTPSDYDEYKKTSNRD